MLIFQSFSNKYLYIKMKLDLIIMRSININIVNLSNDYSNVFGLIYI